MPSAAAPQQHRPGRPNALKPKAMANLPPSSASAAAAAASAASAAAKRASLANRPASRHPSTSKKDADVEALHEKENEGAEERGTGAARLCDLCEADKRKVAKLIKQVVTAGQEREELLHEVDREKAAFEGRLNQLRNQNREIIADNANVRAKLASAYTLLRTYQHKIRAMDLSGGSGSSSNPTARSLGGALGAALPSGPNGSEGAGAGVEEEEGVQGRVGAAAGEGRSINAASMQASGPPGVAADYLEVLAQATQPRGGPGGAAPTPPQAPAAPAQEQGGAEQAVAEAEAEVGGKGGSFCDPPGREEGASLVSAAGGGVGVGVLDESCDSWLSASDEEEDDGEEGSEEEEEAHARKMVAAMVAEAQRAVDVSMEGKEGVEEEAEEGVDEEAEAGAGPCSPSSSASAATCHPPPASPYDPLARLAEGPDPGTFAHSPPPPAAEAEEEVEAEAEVDAEAEAEEEAEKEAVKAEAEAVKAAAGSPGTPSPPVSPPPHPAARGRPFRDARLAGPQGGGLRAGSMDASLLDLVEEVELMDWEAAEAASERGAGGAGAAREVAGGGRSGGRSGGSEGGGGAEGVASRRPRPPPHSSAGAGLKSDALAQLIEKWSWEGSLPSSEPHAAPLQARPAAAEGGGARRSGGSSSSTPVVSPEGGGGRRNARRPPPRWLDASPEYEENDFVSHLLAEEGA